MLTDQRSAPDVEFACTLAVHAAASLDSLDLPANSLNVSILVPITANASP